MVALQTLVVRVRAPVHPRIVPHRGRSSVLPRREHFSWPTGRPEDIHFGPWSTRTTKTVMVHLPGTVGAIAVPSEPLQKRGSIAKRIHLANTRGQPVNTSARWTQAREDGDTRGIADRRLAMRVQKRGATGGKSIQRGRTGSRVRVVGSHPIVQIVHRYEQNVRWPILRGLAMVARVFTCKNGSD
jgi:hypothetical protein